MGILKKWKERRAQKRKLREWSELASALSTLDKMAKAGLLVWNAQTRQLLIDSNLALLMMQTAEKWVNFVRGLYVWTQNQRIMEAWEAYRQKEELAAVREYMAAHKGKNLSREDIDRIREARRLQMVQTDVEPPKVEGYEFLVIGPPKDLEHIGDSPSVNAELSHGDSPRVSAPVGEVVAVGHYDPETDNIEMATWEEVRSLVQRIKS